MKNGSAMLLALVLLAIAGTVWYRYDQYVLKGNFLLEANTACNPDTEQCFVSDCSPEEDIECDTGPYKKVEILARDAPKCLEEHSCEAFSCPEGIEDCSITYCTSDEDTDEGETCFIPQDESVGLEATPGVEADEEL